MLDQATWQATGSDPVAEAVGENTKRREARGEPLDQYIAARQGPIDVDREAEIVGQLAHALAKVHQSGRLHLEVRPSTIRVDTWTRTAALADPASHTNSDPASHAFVEPTSQPFFDSTSAHAAAGDGGRSDRIPGFCDLPYVSAEVLAREPADASDDVYAFACVAYELLTGLHPYARRSALDALDGRFQPAVIDGLNERQNAALLRALEPRRDARRISMQELAAAFGADFMLNNTPLGIAARVLRPHAQAAFTAIAAFLLGVVVHSMWVHVAAPTQTTVAALPATPWWGTPVSASAPAGTEQAASALQERDAAVPESFAAAETKRLTVMAAASPSRDERIERAADRGGEKSADRANVRHAVEGSDRAIPKTASGAERQADPALSAAEFSSSRGGGELSAARAAALQTQASAAGACPSCSCSDLGMKRFVAGVSLNWEEANFYLNVCAERG